MDEQQLIRLFLSTRTEDVFSALFVAVYPRVRRYFILRNVEEATAEELAQTVLFRVYQKAAELRDPALFAGWLFAIARNELLQHWRKQQSRIETEAMTAEAENVSAAAMSTIWLEFDEWLTLLEPNERELVLLRFVEGLTYEELAAALGLPLGTVESRLFSVRKKLLRIVGAEVGAKVSERKQPNIK